MIKYYVGQVLPKDADTAPDEVRMKFTRKTVFTFDDISHIQINDIILLLPGPKICKRRQISFQISFAGYSVQ